MERSGPCLDQEVSQAVLVVNLVVLVEQDALVVPVVQVDQAVQAEQVDQDTVTILHDLADQHAEILNRAHAKMANLT